MSNCYKNFPIIITYGDSSTDQIFSNTTSLSESLDLQTALSLGVKGSSSVFNKEVPKGQISVDSYLMNDLSVFNELKGSNDQQVSVRFGPYSSPAPCIMTSMSVSITVGEPITVSRSFDYFGSVATSSSPTPSSPSLSPMTPDNITLAGFDGIGSLQNINSINWSFSQSYKEYYLLGELVPTIIFEGGQVTLDINGEGLPAALTSANESCVNLSRNYQISVFDCDSQNLGSLIIDGHMQSRNSTVSSEQDETNSASIIQYI